MTRARALLVAVAAALAFAAHAQESPPPANSDTSPPPDSQSTTTPPPASSDNTSTATPEPKPQTVETVPVKGDEAPQPAKGEATELETINVTASKRIKAQRDIPGSVGAIRGQDLEAMRAQGMKDYMKTIPGVIYPDQGNEETSIIIRGISTDLSFGATAATTGVYMDDMPFADLFSPSSVPDLNPFDLERVEVLKGPQGTLFGSGALAGAVRYIVQKPEFDVWQAKVTGTFEKTEQSAGIAPVLGGAVNVPIGETLALRAVAVTRKEPGLYDESAEDKNHNSLRNDPDSDRGKQQSARVLAAWRPLDDLNISAFYFNQTTHQKDFGLADPGANNLGSNQFPFASPRDHDFGGGNLSVNYDLSWAHVLSSTNKMTKHNYAANHQEFGFGLQNQNSQEYLAAFGDDIDGYTQEVRLSSLEGSDSPWEWLVGGSFMHYGNTSFQYSYVGPDKPDPTSVDQISDADKAAAQVFATTDQVAYETAAFGEITRKLGKSFEVTAGARKYETKLKAHTNLCGAQVAALFPPTALTGSCLPQDFRDKADGINPKFSVRYIHNENVQAYVLAAKGFQFGGLQVNPPAPGFPESAQQAGYSFGPYKSSKLWNYELGLRTEWLDRTLRFDTTFFYLDWRDLQLTIEVPLVPTNVPFAVVANVGRAHSEGVEMAFEILPFAGAKFTSSAAFMNAVTDELFDQNASDGGVKPGTSLPGAPHFEWSTVASYEHAMPYFTSWTVGPSLTWAYIGQSTDKIRATGMIGGYATIDARIDLTAQSLPFQPQLSLGMNNLTDVRGLTYHLGGKNVTTGDPYNFDHYITPRTVLLSVALKY